MNPVGLGPGLRPHLAPAALHTGLIPVVESVLGASTSWACALSTFQPHMALLPNSYPPPKSAAGTGFLPAGPGRHSLQVPPHHPTQDPRPFTQISSQPGDHWSPMVTPVLPTRVLVKANGNGTAPSRGSWELALVTFLQHHRAPKNQDTATKGAQRIP